MTTCSDNLALVCTLLGAVEIPPPHRVRVEVRTPPVVRTKDRRPGQWLGSGVMLASVESDDNRPAWRPRAGVTYSTCHACGEICEVVDEAAAPFHLDCVRVAVVRPMPNLRRAALLYASWGWPVFPLRPGGKKPLPGSQGFKDATTDPDRIGAWWDVNPACNIGLATGHRFDVIDVDPPHGWVSWAKLIDAGRIPAIHGTVRTRRQGLHAYVEPTGRGNKAGWMPGLDHRGRGGYIVAPPSTADGGGWTWTVKPSPIIKETTT